MLEAGEIAISFQGKVLNQKKADNFKTDVAQRIKDRSQAKTEIDELVQEMLLESIKNNFGTDIFSVDAEEDTLSKQLFQNEKAAISIVIDPIDGTLEYLEGKDTYSINVGVIYLGEVIAALIYFPKLKQLYYLDEQKNPWLIEYTYKLEVKNKKYLKKTNFVVQTNVYVNNRVPNDVIQNLEKNGYTVVRDDGTVSWPEAFIKCILGEYIACVFHSPQIRDVLLGALVENVENGYKVDWQGNKIGWPRSGRIPRVVFGIGTLPKVFSTCIDAIENTTTIDKNAFNRLISEVEVDIQIGKLSEEFTNADDFLFDLKK